MRLRVEPEVFAALPGMEVVVVGGSDLGPGDAPAVAAQWQTAWRGAAEHSRFGNAQSHPHVAPWRKSFLELGVSGKRYPTSVEALLRRALKGGPSFSVHPLVDFYNAVSLGEIVPAGGFDVDDLDGDLELRLTRKGDTFRALDDAEPQPVPAGELAYATGSDVLTRHLVWRQSRKALIRPDSRRVVLVSEVHPDLPEGTADRVAALLVDGLERHFGATTSTARLDASRLVGPL